MAAADTAVSAFAGYRNYERYDGTAFTDRGFQHVPSLAAVPDLLSDLLAA